MKASWQVRYKVVALEEVEDNIGTVYPTGTEFILIENDMKGDIKSIKLTPFDEYEPKDIRERNGVWFYAESLFWGDTRNNDGKFKLIEE